jgi:hypothetical protein
VCFTNFLLLVLIILVGVPSSHFDVGALRNQVTLFATPKAWSLGSPLGLDFVLVFVPIEEATFLDGFVELSNEECHLFESHVLITIFLDHDIGG